MQFIQRLRMGGLLSFPPDMDLFELQPYERPYRSERLGKNELHRSIGTSACHTAGFRANKLPRATNLETVSKTAVGRSLGEATEPAQKGHYHKIRHASDLLKLIDVKSVKARCVHCQRLFDELGQIVDAA